MQKFQVILWSGTKSTFLNYNSFPHVVQEYFLEVDTSQVEWLDTVGTLWTWWRTRQCVLRLASKLNEHLQYGQW